MKRFPILTVLTVALCSAFGVSQNWQQGFDFRATPGYVKDPPTSTYVLASTAYPTTVNGVTFGWASTPPVQSRDRNTALDPRLAGINYVQNGTQGKFYVDLPAAGTYRVSLAIGDGGYAQCWTRCQVQLLDGNTVLATISGGQEGLGYFYDATGQNWSAAAWPGSNQTAMVTLSGTRLTVIVGTNSKTGDVTPLAFLGLQQVGVVPDFSITASPSTLSLTQGSQGTSTISTAISGGFNSAISLSASGVPTGTTVNFAPNPIGAPGAGSSTMTFTVGSGTAVGTYPITVTGSGGGAQHTATVTLTVTAAMQPDFTIGAMPTSLSVAQGSQGTSTISTTISGGFNNAVSLSATGVPSGTTVSFAPNPIGAPGAGSSTMTVMVGANTALGSYPITVTGSGGSIQHSVTVTLNVTSTIWQQGFDFRATAGYVSDPPTATYVLATTAYPTTVNGVTFGWANTSLVQSRDRSVKTDPRLAGINYAMNASPATFYVNLPSPGTYSVALAMGDAGYPECYSQCQVQLLDGNTVLATISGGQEGLGYFYDATGKNWSAAAWPGSNQTVMVTLTSSKLTVLVGTHVNTGDSTTLAFLGVTQVSGAPNFAIAASPTSLTLAQASQGTSTITSTIGGGFNSAVNLSASGVPSGTTVTFSPNPIGAPGAGNSTMTVMVGAGTAVGTYPITVTGNGGGEQESTTVTLTVTAGSQPDYNFAVGPGALNAVQGSKVMAGAYTNLLRGFNSPISLSASGAPTGVTLSFNPNPIPAPGGGSSQITITTANNTPLGTYPITITGTGGGVQHSATLSLTVVSPVWQQGFDFRGTVGYVSDPPGASSVVPEDLYPTAGQLATYGWQTDAKVSGSNRSTSVDSRLAGVNYASNGSPAAFYVDLPSPGTYSLSLAMGDEGYSQCAVQCQIQFKDGDRVVATVSRGLIQAGFFYDANGNQWSAAAWPASNTPLQVAMTGTELTVLVGTGNPTGDFTAIAYLGVQQVSSTPTFALDAPGSVTVGQGEYGTIDISTLLVGSFNSSIAFSASGAPQGVSINFNPVSIPAPGAGTSLMTIVVGGSTAQGTYPVSVTASGGGIVENWPLLLTVGAPTQPDFSLDVPLSISSAPGSQTTTQIDTSTSGSFNGAVTLSATGAPPGVVVSFNPNPVPAPGAGTSTMMVAVPSNIPMGSYALTVAGDSNGIHHTAPITLTVSSSGKVNLPAGTGWVQLGGATDFCNESPGSTYFNESVGAVDAFDFLSLCQQGTMVAYSGGAADINGDRFLMWTSGHNNYQGNEMYELDLQGSTPTVSRITDPAWTVNNTDVPPDCACRGTLNCGQGMWHDGANNPVTSPFFESAGGGPKFESIPAPDGSNGQPSCGYGTSFQPNARETYAGLSYNLSTHKLLSFGGVPAADPTSTGMYSNWSLDLLQKPPKWSRLKDSSYLWYTAAIYDYTSGHATSGYHLVFDQQQTLYAYNESTDQYTTLANTLPYLGYNVNMELDPVHHSAVLENGDNFGGYHLRIVNLDSCNGTTCAFTNLDQETSCSGALGYWAGMAWDSKRKVMAIFPSATNCSGNGCVAPFNKAYLLNPDANNPVTITYKGVQQSIPPQKCFAVSYGTKEGVDYPTVSVGPGVYSRFKYFPNEDVYLFVQQSHNGVWILRLE